MWKKTIVIFFIVILFFSCSDDDENYFYGFLPIEEAFVPDEFEYGEIYNLSVKYIRPDNCYLYSDIIYEYDLNARNVAVISTVIDDDNCIPLNEEREISFRVHALQQEDYIFRFWQGDDENGDPIYLEIIVPVINFNNNNKSAYEFKTTHTKV
ncbi:MAG: hypothetical protein ABFR05_03180 [Bacteroidota bacterium]